MGTYELALASPSTTEIHALVYALTEGEREIASKREGEREGERERRRERERVSEIVFFKDSNNFCLACSDMIWTFSSVR